MPECSLFQLAQHVAQGRGTADVRPRFALFLGAGASIGSNIPGAAHLTRVFREQLLERWKKTGAAEEFEQWVSRQAPSWDSNASDYSNFFEAFEPMQRGRSRYIEQLVTKATPSCGYLFLTQLLGRGYIDTVLTTNFDELVYEACARWHAVRPRVYVCGVPGGPIRHESGRPVILKLHGDYLHSRLPKNTHSELQVRDLNMENEVAEIVRTYELIVIGYSGQDDSIMTLFEELPENHDGGVYWCVYGGEPQRPRAEQLLKRKNWFRVETNGFDSVMGELLHSVGFVLPDIESAVAKEMADTFRMIIGSGSPYRREFLGDATAAENERTADRGLEAQWSRAFADGIRAYHGSGPAAAAAFLQKAYELIPCDASTAAALGLALTQAGSLSDALAILTTAKAQHPNNPDILSSLGFALTRVGKISEAITVMAEARELNRGSTVLVSGLCWALIQADRTSEALQILRDVPELYPDSAVLLSTHGFALARAGNISEALQMLKRAEGLYPNDPDVLSSLAFALMEADDMHGAYAALRHANECRPGDAAILYDLGITLSRINGPEAGRYFEQVLTIGDGATEDLSIRKWRALSLLALGRSDEALGVLAGLADFLPNSKIYLDDAKIDLRRLANMNIERADECLALIDSALKSKGTPC